jgi:predicted aspartyl protease
MLEGRVSDEGVPTIPLVVGSRTWEATIDTGFNGYFELPELLRDELELEYQGRVISILASGVQVEEDSYLTRLVFDDEPLRASVTFAPVSELLIGTRALSNHTLEIHFPARTVKMWRVKEVG